MTSILLQDPTVALALGAEDPEERFTITGVDWSQYEDLLVKLGDRVRYRITYLEGMLEIMSPSREHELQKKTLAACWKHILKRHVHAFGDWVRPHFVGKHNRGVQNRTSVIVLERRKHFPIWRSRL
jgi:hypothetical protein